MPVIYLDNAATSFPKAPGVSEAVVRFMTDVGANAGRSSHHPAQDASRMLYAVREACAGLLGLAEPDRLAFTKNATEALNLVLMGQIPPGGTVILSSLEHNAVMRPLRHLEAARGARLVVVPFDACGRPDPGLLRQAVARSADLFVLTAASNVTGCLTPVREIADLCRGAGIPLCLDASQAVGHVDIPAEDIDFLCFPGHKGLLGPMGTGGVYFAPGRGPEPLLRGGTGSASDSERQPDFLPDRYEAGTQNLPGLAGLLAAVGFLRDTGLAAVRARESALCDRLLRGLLALPGVASPGPAAGEPRVPVISIRVEGRDLGEIALELDRRDIATRMGLHCAPAAHRSLGTLEAGGTLRFSPGFFTTEGEIDAAVQAMEEILA
ncbi:MAG TPA: aminotransferase class V-fold PLP-dependent enzyme [Holophaga sp.]|nr:aminotransferase class V-fold PLP-dependent enzyme [Holophaga sp.]